MIRTLSFAGSLMVLVLGMYVGSASAQPTCDDPSPFPANNATVCEDVYGGTFESDPPTRTCTVVTGPAEVSMLAAPGCNEASLAAGFKATYEVTTTTVYTRSMGECSVQVTTSSTLVACHNRRGKPTSLQPCLCPNDNS